MQSIRFSKDRICKNVSASYRAIINFPVLDIDRATEDNVATTGYGKSITHSDPDRSEMRK